MKAPIALKQEAAARSVADAKSAEALQWSRKPAPPANKPPPSKAATLAPKPKPRATTGEMPAANAGILRWCAMARV